MSGPDYILDVKALKPDVATGGEESPQADAPKHGPAEHTTSLRGRPWLAIHWRCCSAYSRIYRDPSGDGYHGRCPRCARPLNIAVGEGGTDSRFFEAS